MIRSLSFAAVLATTSLTPGQDPQSTERTEATPEVERKPAAVGNQAARIAEQPPQGERAPFVFEIGDWPIRTVVERCAAYLQYNVLVDDLELVAAQQARTGGGRGKAPVTSDDLVVSLTIPVVTDRDGCEELLTSLLWSFGLLLVPLDEEKQVHEVLAMGGRRANMALATAPQRTPEEVLARPTLKSLVTTVYRLEHTNAQLANNALRPFFAGARPGNMPGLQIGNVGNTTSMIMSGPQCMVASALKLLAEADAPPNQPTDEYRRELDELKRQNDALAARLAAIERAMRSRKDG